MGLIARFSRTRKGAAAARRHVPCSTAATIRRRRAFDRAAAIQAGLLDIVASPVSFRAAREKLSDSVPP
jgi:hypothetical protein